MVTKSRTISNLVYGTCISENIKDVLKKFLELLVPYLFFHK